MKELLNYLRPNYFKMSVGLFFKFAGTITDLLIPWILAYMIDEVVPLRRIPLIVLWGLVMVLCSVAALVTNIIANRMAARVAGDTTEKIRHDLFSRITSLSCRQIDGFTVPSLVSRLTSDTYNVHNMVGMLQRLGVRAPILLLGGIMLTLTLDTVLTLVLLAIMPLLALLVYFVSKKGIPLYTRLQQSVDNLVRTVRENITGIRVIKALSRTEHEKRRFGDVNNQVVDNEKLAGKVMAISNPTMNLLLNLGLTLVILVGAYRTDLGLTQPGKIIAFLTYFTIILNAMMTLTRIFVLISKGTASFQRISEVIQAPSEPSVLPAQEKKGEEHIAFRQVSFSYHKRENSVENIDFSLNRGETLGIIGATGSGKSTVIRLLLRFYDTDEGQILIDGRDIRSIPEKELYSLFGVVFQNDVLYADTIAENIAFGRDLSHEQILKAAVCAQASEFIESKEDGLLHKLTIRGSNLSGGQKQRLLIARALAAMPDILILDDSSSALDYKTDSMLRKALHQSFSNTTTLIVAQRISSIMHADRILFLDEGKIIGYGTHEELLDVCPLYQEIAKAQLGGCHV